MKRGRAASPGHTYLIKLPDAYWEFIESQKEKDCLIKSKSDGIIYLLRKAYPELKEKESL